MAAIVNLFSVRVKDVQCTQHCPPRFPRFVSPPISFFTPWAKNFLFTSQPKSWERLRIFLHLIPNWLPSREQRCWEWYWSGFNIYWNVIDILLLFTIVASIELLFSVNIIDYMVSWYFWISVLDNSNWLKSQVSRSFVLSLKLTKAFHLNFVRNGRSLKLST